MKIAHLSDIHFFKFDLKLHNLFSKNLLATCNYLFNRSRHRFHFDLFQVPKFIQNQGVEKVIITGDFTTTSNYKEFASARKFIKTLKDQNLEVIFIPGNHDTYTRRADQGKRFYKELSLDNALKTQAVVTGDLTPDYKYIALDTTLATPYWSSQGLFSKAIEEKLIKAIESFDRKQPLVLVNHFPIASRKKSPFRHQMIHYKRLKVIVENYSNIKLYLFGHTHLSEMIASDPVLLNSGSLTLTDGGSFHIMDLKPGKVDVQAFGYDKEWKLREKRAFQL